MWWQAAEAGGARGAAPRGAYGHTLDSRFRGNDGVGGRVRPLWSPAGRGDGRNMLRPYGLVSRCPGLGGGWVVRLGHE